MAKGLIEQDEALRTAVFARGVSMMDVATIRRHMMDKGHNDNPSDGAVVRWALRQAVVRIQRQQKR